MFVVKRGRGGGARVGTTDHSLFFSFFPIFEAFRGRFKVSVDCAVVSLYPVS